MKAIKFLFKLVLWIAVVFVALVLTLPLWVGPVVRTAANAIVPKQTGTAFNLGSFGLNPYVGTLKVGDMQLGNPDGFEQKMAVTLGTLSVSVDTGSVASDVVVVRDIVLKDVFVSYVTNAKGENNFAVLAKNAGDDEAPEVKKAAKKAEEPKEADDDESEKKVILDHVLIENVVVQLGPVSVPMPKIEMTGIGRKSGGVTMEEAWNQIYVQVMSSLNSVGEFANQLSKMGVDVGDLSLEQAAKAVDAARNADIKGMTDALKGGSKTVGEGAGKTIDAVGESAGKAVDAIKSLF